MAYIRKYRDKWRAEVQKHGRRATHVADTKREAQAWALKKEDELEAMKGSKGRTFGWAREHYVSTVSTTKSEGTPQWEEHRFEAMAEFFGDATALTAIDSETVGKWRDWRLKGDETHKPVTGSTVLREVNLLRNLFTIAVQEWKCLKVNPCSGVRLPDHNPPRQTVWHWQTIKRVLRANRSGKTLEVIRAFHIALHTGMRLSEVLAAKPEGKVAVLPKDKTTKMPVRVPLARKGAKLLRKYAPFTVGANEASTLFSGLCNDLLIEGLTFHDSRATALTLLSRRMDVMTLARVSRHKDLRILLETYYRETVDQIAARI